jgi:hypothetical protein
MKELRDRGLYRLPDGAELVASFASRGEGYVLYHPKVWKSYGVPDYRVDAQGCLSRMGESTNWRDEDLIDTGETAE